MIFQRFLFVKMFIIIIVIMCIFNQQEELFGQG